MKKLRDERFIHIVGMYKSGTSWLLHILANHPEVVAWREFDVIRAVYDYRRTPLRFYGIILNRLLRVCGLGGRLSGQFDASIKERETIIRNIFCGTGWMPMLGVDKQRRAMDLDFSDPDNFLENLLSIDQIKLQSNDSPDLLPDKFHNTLGVANTRMSDLEKFLRELLCIQDLKDIPKLYFTYLRNQVIPNAYIALKAADQLIGIEQLRQVSPHSKKIVIVRDGRDAALSALAFAKLMSKWEAPWTPKNRDYLQILNAWALRVSLLEKESRKGDLIILRYEDLTTNFKETCKNLFNELGLSDDPTLIRNIKKNTDFKVVSGGRNPGDKAEHLVRLGVIGEWMSELGDTKRALAWRMASQELSLLGYKEKGGFDNWEGCVRTEAL